jgi:hypothetical protein
MEIEGIWLDYHKWEVVDVYVVPVSIHSKHMYLLMFSLYTKFVKSKSLQ